jgi:hypothetical protein
MIEKMEAVPCGSKERGLTGLGSVFASIGATRISSDEKLCQEYMLRSDDMEYRVRPLDHKHPTILPVGQEGEFKVSKDVIVMRIPDGDRKKRRYQVVAIERMPISRCQPSAPKEPPGLLSSRPRLRNKFVAKALVVLLTGSQPR